MPLYDYQKKVARLLRSGKSVVLQAPTGAGKTRAALWPFLEAYDRQAITFPAKCVYVVPMRVLAHQFIDSTRRTLREEMLLTREPRITIQTGDQPDDRRFESDLIFCTVDQFLSSYLTMPYGLPNRWANLNAGAMVGAYLVFDEFHLFDPSSTLPSVLYATRQLCQLAPVLIMTATFSATMLETLAGEINAEVVLVSQAEARQIENRTTPRIQRQRMWRTADAPLSAAAVLAAHRTRSLALCNTVRGAQALFRELRQSIVEQNLDIRLLLLHSRFLPDDRRETESHLRWLFGNNEEADRSGSVIAVATQAIEVGVDITSETLHTELAPASALIQRAGRCARYPGEQGQVIVYPVEKYAPYGQAHNDPEQDDVWVKEMKAAWSWLTRHNGEAFDFSKEQDFVNAVSTPRDEKILLELSAGSGIRTEKIHQALLGDDNARDSRLLVRDADSRYVLIHPKPDELLTDPYGATRFNLSPEVLYGMTADWLKRELESGLEWGVKYLVGDEKEDKSEDNRMEYGWKPLNNVQLLSMTRMVVVNPLLAGYLKDEGFVADRGDTEFCSTLPPRNLSTKTWEGRYYKLETYEDHIRRVLEAFQVLALPELRYPARALEKAAGWSDGSVLYAAWLVCLLHDVGKLSQGWQGWVRAYQKQIGSPVGVGFAAAHTDAEWNNPVHKAAEQAIRGKHKKPHHAGEGALATSRILTQAFGQNEPLVKAALTAITRHHTPFARECELYSLEPQAKDHIQATIEMTPADIGSLVDVGLLKSEAKSPANSFSGLMSEPSDTYGWLAYTLLVRALRRADQAGTARGSKEV